MAALVATVRLNSGHTMPVLGLGVYKSQPGQETYDAVLSALKLGYRHIDTAQIYSNEEDVGKAVKASGIPRQELFVTTKLWKTEWGYDKASSSLRESLGRLGLSYVDLLLLHCPGDPESRAETWRALEDAQQQGLVRSIGVSNYGVPHLERLLQSAQVVPAVNQIELSPFLQRREVVDYCRGKGTVLQAYSPLCKASKLSHPTLTRLASLKAITPAQLLLAWSLAKGFVPLPKSVKAERQAENLAAVGVRLTAAEVAELDGLEEGLVTGWDPISDDPE